MEKEKFGEQFLHQQGTRLHTSEAVEKTQKRLKDRGERISQKPADKIAAYLERLENIFNPEPLEKHPNFDRRERNLELLKRRLYEEVIIKSEGIPESYFENQKRLAREQGHGDIEITDEMREQLSEVIISDQRTTLDNWVDYFTSSDSESYPMWAKYWAFAGMLKLSTYDKEKHSFDKRDKDTVAPFPDLNREALAYAVDVIVKKAKQEHISDAEDNPELQKLLQGANFGKLYAYAIEKVTPTEENELINTKGIWVKFPQNTAPTTYIPEGFDQPLVPSLQGYGTGWCTAGETTARIQLQGGDFYVYYSYDKNGQPIIPRVAIRMQDQEIGEVRGVAPEQNLDPFIGDVVTEKLQDFGQEGEAYQKKSADMKYLTAIERRSKRGEELSKDDLRFLYEIDAPIGGFGYQCDPRIKEIKDQRNPEEDAPIVFECSSNEIAWKQEDVNEKTKAYIGEWNVEIFQKIRQYPDIKHLYESFPDKKIFMRTIETDSAINSPESAEQAFKEKNIYLYDWAKDILSKTKFSKESQTYELAQFNVSHLGFPRGATTAEIYKRAQDLGLELCPAEVGLHLRLQYSGKEWILIAMKQITDRIGDPRVFRLDWIGERLGLSGDYAKPEGRWYPDNRFVFLPRKLEAGKL